MSTTTHVTVLDQSEGRNLGVRLQGRLEDSDLETLSEQLRERSSQHGRLNLLLSLKSINNYTPNELWDAVAARTPEIREVARLAMVTEDVDFKRWLAALSTAMLDGEVRHFEPADLREAWQWLREE